MNRTSIAILISLSLWRLVYYLFIYEKPYSPTSNTDSSELWTVVVVCALVPIAAILLIVANAPRPKSIRSPQPQTTAQRPNLSRKEEELYRQLINLLHGDVEAARRLLNDSYTVWNLEKVIYDLVRDRR